MRNRETTIKGNVIAGAVIALIFAIIYYIAPKQNSEVIHSNRDSISKAHSDSLMNIIGNHSDSLDDILKLEFRMFDTLQMLRSKSIEFAVKGNNSKSSYYETRADQYVQVLKKRFTE